jgi:hypothetical protein
MWTYFPPVTKSSSLWLENATTYDVPELGTAAGAPQIASFLSMFQITTLYKEILYYLSFALLF